jgi:hypothetical protein
MSAQADWNYLVTQLQNNFFKLVFFGLECSGPALDNVLTPDLISSTRTENSVRSGNSSSDSLAPRRKKKVSSSSPSSSLRKKVKRLPSSVNKPPSPSPASVPAVAAKAVAKRRRRSPLLPSLSLPSQDAALHVITEDVNFQDLLNYEINNQ